MGKTKNGELSVPLGRLSPGTLFLKGNYSGEPFEFEFELYESDLKYYHRMNYYIPKEVIERLLFDASELNTTLIDLEVFRLVNLEREKAGLKPYRWNQWVRDVAYNHSMDMAEREYFAHKNPEGKDHYDRLKESGMFFIVAGENLYLLEGIGSEYTETMIAKGAVEGWLKSPAHRSIILDVDNLYSDAGVGAFCNDDICYITLNVVGLEEEENTTLDREYAIFYYLNDPGIGFNMEVPVFVEVKASKPVDVYIVSDYEQYDRFLKNKHFEKIYYKESTKYFDKKLNADVGNGLIIYSPSYSDVGIKVNLRYYPDLSHHIYHR